MSYFKDKLLPFLIGGIFAAFSAIVISIWSDLVPSVMPALKSLPTQLYIKIILLLLLLLLIVLVLVSVLYIRTKDYKPRTMKGTYSGFKWVAELDYADKKCGVSIAIHWLCPKHETFLGCKDAKVPECCYSNLFCRKCDRIYEFKSAGDIVYLEEAERIIRQGILSKIRIKKA